MEQSALQLRTKWYFTHIASKPVPFQQFIYAIKEQIPFSLILINEKNKYKIKGKPSFKKKCTFVTLRGSGGVKIGLRYTFQKHV